MMPRYDNLITNKTARLPGDYAVQPTTEKPRTQVTVEKHPNGTGGHLRIVIPGTPVGKPRMTQQDAWAKRPEVVRYRDWCNAIRAVVGAAIPRPEIIAELNWTAYFEPPASWPKKKRLAVIGTRHRQRPDRDNIDKAILDCLFEQDAAIADGMIRKRWDWNARLEVTIILMPIAKEGPQCPL